MVEWTPSDPSGRCVRETVFGTPYEEISCLYPTMGKSYMSWEYYDIKDFYIWMRDNYVWCPFLLCFVYGAGIFVGQKYFATRDAWSWRGTLAVWNLALSSFSTLGFLRMLPQLMHNLYYYGLWGQLCLDPESMVGSSTTGLWCCLFVLSKIPEFGDTFFIVIHKKKLMFLHWYHHMSVLLCCWHSFVSKAPTGLFFGTMNFGVHSIMYFYYFLMAIKSKPKWFNPQWITALQITQMFAGTILSVLAFVTMIRDGDNCWSKPKSNMASLLMYGSYFFLFCQFFFAKYGFAVRAKKEETPQKKSD
ncbi:of very long chain fatty acids protein 6 [Seminavis robusta]|uniref:Elongation of fatty acids protein n=1 Tax=Seminavis robusta TaxID=568900 RepID=A0A9N8DBJ5_9STRA|nr:of very long chain fatty acids protein 6 [Seminavis robusta]|eukprot:Sro20_g014130.1 of very long chain fatty acids protein 6 (303) ;mRNA; r:87685-88791